jgi:hypothetical protein
VTVRKESIMRNLKTLAVIFAVTAFLGAASFAAVGEFSGLKIVGPLSGAQSSLDANPVLWVKYISTTSSTPTVQVAAGTGDIQFEVNGSVDTTVACPEGDDDGVIDVSDGSCDTFIEVVNAINQAGSNWAAVLGPVLTTDSTTDALATLAETDEDLSKGLGLYYDDGYAGATVVFGTPLFPPSVGATTAASGGNAGAFFFSGREPNKNPFEDRISLLTYFRELKGSTGTISNTIVYGSYREYRGNRTVGFDLYDRTRTLWTETGGANDTENTTDFSNFPLISAPGEFLWLRTGSSTNIDAIGNVVTGALAER